MFCQIYCLRLHKKSVHEKIILDQNESDQDEFHQDDLNSVHSGQKYHKCVSCGTQYSKIGNKVHFKKTIFAFSKMPTIFG